MKIKNKITLILGVVLVSISSNAQNKTFAKEEFKPVRSKFCLYKFAVGHTADS